MICSLIEDEYGWGSLLLWGSPPGSNVRNYRAIASTLVGKFLQDEPQLDGHDISLGYHILGIQLLRRRPPASLPKRGPPMRERVLRVLLLSALVASLPSLVSAQALAGVVRDPSGAVLPGVSVEAASPALIEKVRSVVTDGTGQYRIVDLRPGAYRLTFTLPGFNTVVRTGIELSGSGTVTVNSEMSVGGLEETVTVAGETPVVDVQSATRQAVLSGDLVASVPAARSWNGLLLLMPGVTGTPNSMQLTPSMITFGIHGGPTSEGRLLVGGMNVGASRGGGGVSGYQVNTGNVEEVTFATSGGLGEVETGGPYMNIVPKTGGNDFKGGSSFFYSNQSLQSSNFTDELRAAGLRSPGDLLELWDVDFSLGGPINKDKLWFFAVLRNQGNSMSVPGVVREPQCWQWRFVGCTTRIFPDLRVVRARRDRAPSA